MTCNICKREIKPGEQFVSFPPNPPYHMLCYQPRPEVGNYASHD